MSTSTSSNLVTPTENVIAGKAFEDTIDGYFPLRESLRQMLVRNECRTALVFILHAPAMEIPGLAPEDPVPLYITQGHGCILYEMALIVRLVAGNAVVTGLANWNWWGQHRADDPVFSDMHRLAEPAFIRGIQLDFTGVALRTGPVNNDGTERSSLWLHSSLIEGQIRRGRICAEDRTLRLEQLGTPYDSALSATEIALDANQRQRRILQDIFKEM